MRALVVTLRASSGACPMCMYKFKARAWIGRRQEPAQKCCTMHTCIQLNWCMDRSAHWGFCLPYAYLLNTNPWPPCSLQLSLRWTPRPQLSTWRRLSCCLATCCRASLPNGARRTQRRCAFVCVCIYMYMCMHVRICIYGGAGDH